MSILEQAGKYPTKKPGKYCYSRPEVVELARTVSTDQADTRGRKGSQGRGKLMIRKFSSSSVTPPNYVPGAAPASASASASASGQDVCTVFRYVNSHGYGRPFKPTIWSHESARGGYRPPLISLSDPAIVFYSNSTPLKLLVGHFTHRQP